MQKPLPRNFAIETPRLRLRAPSEEDFAPIFEATRHPGFNDGMLWEAPQSVEELREPLERNLRAWDQGESFTFTIVARADGQFLGRIAIRSSGRAGRWNIGFFLHPRHQRKGYMREAAAVVVRFGFDALAAELIEATHATWNTASERVLLSLGMRFVEHNPQGFKKRGEWVAENRLAITRADALCAGLCS